MHGCGQVVSFGLVLMEHMTVICALVEPGLQEFWCYIHGKLRIYMYLYLVSSTLQLVQSFPLAGFWCWASIGEFEGPVGSSYVNRLSPDYFLPIINQILLLVII